jgi:PAS domain S-box-containing protein
MGVRTEESLHWERRARQLLQAVAVAEARTTEEALQSIVDAVCTGTGWPVGHALVRDARGELVSSGVWHLADRTKYARLREVTEESRFAPGIGLPGRVLEQARPLWIMDVSREANFPRAQQAQDLAVHAAFGFPVIVRGQVVAVLEFFSSESAEPDEPLLDVMASIGSIVAQTIERLSVATALERSELSFRSVAQTAHDAIITADGQGRIVSWNHGAERMFGWSENEAVGQSLHLIIPTGLRDRHATGMARVNAGGDRHVIGRTAELRGLRRDGTEFPLELSLAEWSLERERFYTGILRDVTERKRAEEALRRTAEHLAASQKAAVEASRAKTIFLANMSHELRTPLNAILGFVQLMQRDRALGPEHLENLAVIMRSGEHLLGLINDVLSISKIEVGEAELRIGHFDLQHLVAVLQEMFRLRARNRGLDLVVETSGTIPAVVRGDEGKLRQVLINLLGNAIKFTNLGRVALRASYRDDRAQFEVEDTGPGIAPEDQARLFQPFVQTVSGARANEGTGLGLAISREYVHVMGGDLGVDSELGHGARFRFEIPLPAAADVALTRTAGRVVALASGEPEWRILVVDNAEDSRRLLSRLLGIVGFRVAEATNGAEAIEAWKQFAPHLVWMDMRMPVIDGYEATRRIRALEAGGSERPRTAIIALTASAFEQDRPTILAAGCDEIIAKPFREEAIFEAIVRHLGVKFSREEEEPPPVGPALSVAGLLELPASARGKLLTALSDGDDLAAQRTIDQLPPACSSLAAELRRMVKDLRLDELLGLLEEAAR